LRGFITTAIRHGRLSRNIARGQRSANLRSRNRCRARADPPAGSIGISPDFRRHSVAFSSGRCWSITTRRGSRSRYSDVATPDIVTQKPAAAAARRNTAGVADDEVAAHL
jgi:hypothetical protein